MTELLGPFFAPLRLVHALLGVLLVAGVLGRWVALDHAHRAALRGDLASVQALLGASSVFERVVISTSMLVFIFGLLTAWSLGFPLLGFLQGASTNWLLVSVVLYLATILLVPTVFIPRGRAFGAALEDSNALGRPTPALLACFADPVTRVAHYIEVVAIVLVLALMIAKPF